MQAIILSDHPTTALQVREALLRRGYSCPHGQAVTVSQGSQGLALDHADLIVIVMLPDPERALTLLTKLRSQTSAPILMVGPAQHSRLALQTLRLGATDFIDVEAIEADIAAALPRLQAGRVKQGEAGQLIAVLAPSGGSGASTLAVNVATTMAKEQKRVLLVDLHCASGDLGSLLNLKPAHSLADLCLNTASMDHLMFERALVQHESGVHLLACPDNVADLHQVTPEGVSQALALARALFPYVLVDLGNSYRQEEVEAVRQADLILLVLRLDFSSVRNGQRALNYLKHLGVEPDKLRLVVNRYGQPKEVPAAKAEEALGMKVFHYVPEDARTANRANNNGVPLVLESPSAKIARSLATLAHAINGRSPGQARLESRESTQADGEVPVGQALSLTRQAGKPDLRADSRWLRIKAVAAL